MAIFSKSIEQANAAVSKAAGVVTDWEKKAAAARAEAARLDAESGAAILEDESAAERITLNVQTWERKARAYDQAAEEARRKLLVAQREALEAEAREEDKQAAGARKAADAHVSKVAALLNELRDLDGVEYVVGRALEGYARDHNLAPIPRSAGLANAARAHEVRAALIRYFAKTGKITHDITDLNTELGTSIPDYMRTIPGEGIEIPKSLFVARDAGLNFTGSAA